MSELWDLVWAKPEVDPNLLAKAVASELVHLSPGDIRMRMLVRDSLNALEQKWGDAKFNAWVEGAKLADRVHAIRTEPLETGFPTLTERLVERTDPATVKQFLRELGQKLQQPTRLEIGGSVALILTDYINRSTEDIDVVDQLPDVIRTDHALLETLAKRYNLALTHFQSHYLPNNWRERLNYFDKFGQLEVFLVDVYDVFVGKLFSVRDKDFVDLRIMVNKLDQHKIEQRFRDSTKQLMQDPKLRKAAADNWYVIFGSQLPVAMD